MIERRKSHRDRVIYSGVAAVSDRGLTRDCVIRNISEHGAALEFGSAVGVPEQLALTVPKKARTYPSRVVWRRGNTIGVSFRHEAGDTELGERLRRSERKTRELRRRIKVLLGEA